MDELTTNVNSDAAKNPGTMKDIATIRNIREGKIESDYIEVIKYYFKEVLKNRTLVNDSDMNQDLVRITELLIDYSEMNRRETADAIRSIIKEIYHDEKKNNMVTTTETRLYFDCMSEAAGMIKRGSN